MEFDREAWKFYADVGVPIYQDMNRPNCTRSTEISSGPQLLRRSAGGPGVLAPSFVPVRIARGA
jgi:hypothetical protein